MDNYHLIMEKEMPKIKVLDQHTGQTLFECSLQDSEKAYQFAAQMEEMGLDIKVISPTLTETLTNSLGLSPEARAAYSHSVEEEIEQHEGSCCFEEPDPNKPLN
jgi:hypothetical protein